MSVSRREFEVFSLLERAQQQRKHLREATELTTHSLIKSNDERECDVVVTYNEVSSRHGTGTLLIHLFGEAGEGIFSLRSQNTYGGRQRFGQWQQRLDLSGLTRKEVFQLVLETLGALRPQRVLCIPFDEQDVWVGLALKDAYDVPLCVYLMDDNCLYGKYRPISKALMGELLDKADLRFSISRELRIEYERQFNVKFYTLPPVVPDNLILRETMPLPDQRMRKGVIIGNIWSEFQFEALRKLLRESGMQLDWFCQNYGHFDWMQVDKELLQEEGLCVRTPLPEEELQKVLLRYPYAVMPTGTLSNPEDLAESVARLSLPSRILFLIATAHLPVVVLGHPDTAAAKFVCEHELGICCDYDHKAYERCLEEQVFPLNRQTQYREKALSLGQRFSAEGMGDWVWSSLSQGAPADARFEELFAAAPGEPAVHVDASVPEDLFYGFHDVYRSLYRLKHSGMKPDWFVDAGCSTGAWSHVAAQLFPDVSYLLIDPLLSEYELGGYCLWQVNPSLHIEKIEAAIGAESGEVHFNVSPDLYNSSFQDERTGVHKRIQVPVITLDSLIAGSMLQGRFWLKLDLQFAEHLALQGGEKFMQQVDICFVELSLWRQVPQSCTLHEMIDRFSGLGFRVFDECGGWRNHTSGRLFQMDLVFMRESLFVQGTPEEQGV